MGSKRAGNGVEKVYDAAQKWVDCALRGNGSLFTPGKEIWTRKVLALLHEKFLNNPDDTDGNFLDKLEQQLKGSPAEVYQLMGEALYFYFLIVHTKSGADEKNVIDTVLKWSELPVEMSSEFVAALTPGIATPGTAYHTFRPFQVGLLIEIAERLKQEEPSKRAHLLDDPWAFKRYVMDFRPRSRLVSKYQNASRIQRQALLHLVHPDTFEGIVSEDHKSAAAAAFDGLVKQPTDDVDSKLAQIRERLEAQYGIEGDVFYHCPIRRQWQPDHECENCPPKKDVEEQTSWWKKDLGNLAVELLWDPAVLQQILIGLEDKGQVIFQGPPGTGKTFVAKRLGEWVKEHGGDFKIVQFHPSYSYEDFVEGYRPTLSGNQAGFELRDGPLKEIADEANKKSEATFILVIDEINRTNVSKVMGELYFLLEYRGEPAELLYSKRKDFTLPKNLWIIGTMNTTDRSIALVDAALRRRFYFYNFFPDQPPIEGLLRRWLEKNDHDMIKVADLVDHVNKALEDRHLSIGPSHFMKKEKLNKDKVRFIWERAVFPYIEEQLFGGRGDIEKYKFEKLESILDGNDNVPSEGSTT